MLHVEFTVKGPPVSQQTRDRANLQAWKKAVRDEAARRWANPPLTCQLKFTVINFHEGDQAPLDDDNMVKPIRDALNSFVYKDDKQIAHSETIQVGIEAPVKIRRGSRVLLEAYTMGDEFVYVRVEDAPDFIQLPQ
jgi:crossover junction endodeoxyribonuclease RusA